MYKQSDSINELATALSAAQRLMEGAAKDSANPFFKSRYADLSSIWLAIREPLGAHGLSVIQMPAAEGSKITITTLLCHTSGQWISSELTMAGKDDSPQGIGSAITYARRYALAAMAGVAPEDDDAEGAQGRRQEPQRQERPAQLPAPEKPTRQVPAELVKVFERMMKEPAHFNEACEMLMHKLEDEQGRDGLTKYDKHQRAFTTRFSGGKKPGMADLQGFLLDLWEAADVAPKQ